MGPERWTHPTPIGPQGKETDMRYLECLVIWWAGHHRTRRKAKR